MTTTLLDKELRRKGTPIWLDYTPADMNHLQECLHEPHLAARKRILEALGPSYYPAHRRAAASIDACCNSARIYIDPDTGQVRPWVRRCKHRLCPFCARGRQSKVAKHMDALIDDMEHPRQIILTVKSTNRPLSDQLCNLRRSFRKLRSKKAWKDRVAGGMYVVECTLNESTGLWHPHLHIIFDGQYMPFKLLQYHWHKVTGSSQHVWVQDVTDRRTMISELTKYIGKPQRVMTWPAQKIQEYATAISGTRMYQAFGSFHGRTIPDTDNNPDLSPATYSVSIPHLLHLAKQGDPTPQRLIALIALRWPMFAPYIYHGMPQLEPPETKERKKAAARARITGGSAPRGPPMTAADVQSTLDTRLFTQFSRHRQETEAE